ncbi:MAG: carbonate dehydratase [Methylococcales bacterium]|nr:carbonate dehydratase [Methylococcales bacterium]
MTDKNPDFFTHLSKQQTPDYLWIGCSDSRVPANQVVDLEPGEVFVHRNIANIVVHSDLNCLSVLQFAVEVLNVKHIIVCGHYGCGGVKAALDGCKHGLIDNWLGHIKDVYRLYKTEIDALSTEEKRVDLLCEKNVIEQVANVCHSTIVQDAWNEKKDLTVHGWIYSINNGLLKALDTEVSSKGMLRLMHSLKK